MPNEVFNLPYTTECLFLYLTIMLELTSTKTLFKDRQTGVRSDHILLYFAI